MPSKRPRATPVGGNSYRVIEAETTEELSERVERLMERGWEPQGGVAVCPRGGPVLHAPLLLQAMIRRA
jgi:hypothetical protein